MLKNVFIAVGLIVAAGVGSLVFVHVAKKRASEAYFDLLLKPEGILDVGDLLERDPEIREVYWITNTPSASIVVTLEPPRGTSHFYSGPPAFIFDDQGRSVHWSKDIGDDPELRNMWPPNSWPLSGTNEVNPQKLREFSESIAGQEGL